MLKVIFALGFVGACLAQVKDKVCLDKDLKYTAESVLCADTADWCATVYKVNVTANTTKDRDELCYTTDKGVTVNEGLKKQAIESCPKTCGYCCLTPEWSCENPVGNDNHMVCDTVTQDMCKEPFWKVYLTENCPNKCGFCKDTSGGCVDLDTDACTKLPDICTNYQTIDYAMKNCAKTCNNCDGSKTPTTTKRPDVPVQQNCVDARGELCVKWNLNGYCNLPSSEMSTATKKKACAKTCNMCDSPLQPDN